MNNSFFDLSQFQVLRNLCFRSLKKKSGDFLTNLKIVAKFSASPKVSSAIIILHIYPNFYTEGKKVVKLITNNKQCTLIFVNNQLDAQFFFMYVYFYSLHVSGSHARLIQTCTPNGHLYRVTYTRCRIDTINSPDDGHMAARNM
jgi:hypothetical protein